MYDRYNSRRGLDGVKLEEVREVVFEMLAIVEWESVHIYIMYYSIDEINQLATKLN